LLGPLIEGRGREASPGPVTLSNWNAGSETVQKTIGMNWMRGALTVRSVK
jgi:hypothetical protein